MEKPAYPTNEAERISSLRRMNILSSPREADLDRITDTARTVFGVDISLVSLVDSQRQWFMSRSGLNGTETSRESSFCAHAILSDETLVVSDTAVDERFFDNPLVTGEPSISFYAGAPIKNEEGFSLGTLCVIDSKTRNFSASDIGVLENLARMTELVINNRRLSETQCALLDSLVEAQRDKLIDPLSGLWNRRGLDELFHREIARCARRNLYLGCAMVDIDHFKRVNDTYGHQTGDLVIKKLAGLLVTNARSTDLVARYGGDEFIVVAPDLDEDDVQRFGDKIVDFVLANGSVDFERSKIDFTVSVGVSCMKVEVDDREIENVLIKQADHALQESKSAGRGCARALF